ncbi:MAG: ArnT family glycosyltransferase [Chloroflexia bacterium]
MSAGNTQYGIRNREFVALALLLLFTFVKGVLWSGLVVSLDAPDEPSHLNHIVQIRDGTWLPVVDMVSPGGLRTPPSTPLNQEARDYFARYNYKFFRSMPYESTQPPLYYWAAAIWTRPIPVTAANMPTLLSAARLFSVLLGTAAVLALWLACRWIWPQRSWQPWVAPLALTLSPQFTFTTATVSNDAAVIFWGAALLAVWAHGLRPTMDYGRYATGAGEAVSLPPSPLPYAIRKRQYLDIALAALVSAAGVLTKLTFVATVPASLLWIYWVTVESARPGRSTASSPLRRGLLLAGGYLAVVGVLVLPWVLRNLRVYGEPTGARGIVDLMHRIYWDRLGFPSSQLFSRFPLDEFVVRSARSFWALFGWASVWLADWVYWLQAALAAISGLGLLLRGLRAGFPPRSPLSRVAALALLACILAFANYVGYNSLVEFQPHMRLTFAALAPAIFLLALGLEQGPWPRWRAALSALLLASLALAQGLSIAALLAHRQDVVGVTYCILRIS